MPETREEIIVVSGLPRSGTSMMMKMVEAGGVDVVTDNIRKADIDNPKGYYEFEQVKQIEKDSSWMPRMKGRAFKMVAMLLKHLPEGYRYKVIFMRRDMKEMLASQSKMLERMGKPGGVDDATMEMLFRKHLAEMEVFLKGRPDIEVLEVNFRDVMERPAFSAEAVAGFLGGALDVEAMTAIVDPNLYRNRKQ